MVSLLSLWGHLSEIPVAQCIWIPLVGVQARSYLDEWFVAIFTLSFTHSFNVISSNGRERTWRPILALTNGHADQEIWTDLSEISMFYYLSGTSCPEAGWVVNFVSYESFEAASSSLWLERGWPRKLSTKWIKPRFITCVSTSLPRKPVMVQFSFVSIYLNNQFHFANESEFLGGRFGRAEVCPLGVVVLRQISIF